MRPAFSIVVFTVLSGAGLGLAAMLAAIDFSGDSLIIGGGMSFLLTAGGLGISILHLANPKNAWRAIMRVRTSWLSREAALAAAFFPLILIWLWCAQKELPIADAFRAAVFIVAILTIICTAMIYQSLKPIGEWHHPLTCINYLLQAGASGAVLSAAILSFFGDKAGGAKITALLFLIAAAAGKILHYLRIGKAKDITVGRATGFTQAKVRLLEAGHTAPNFLTREFVYYKSAVFLQRMRYAAMTLAFAMPSAIIMLSKSAAIAAAVFMFAGLLIERWLFFAEARHTVRLYHGDARQHR